MEGNRIVLLICIIKKHKNWKEVSVIKILFVCMGNICRSPAAEGIMKKKLSSAGLEKLVEVDSAGTIGYHEGEPPDARMIIHASGRGYKLDHKARKFNANKDADYFDYILTMDSDNYNTLMRMDKNNKIKDKVYRITDFSTDKKVREVPDPYYGGSEGFERVIDILEDCIDNFLIMLRADIEKRNLK